MDLEPEDLVELVEACNGKISAMAKRAQISRAVMTALVAEAELRRQAAVARAEARIRGPRPLLSLRSHEAYAERRKIVAALYATASNRGQPAAAVQGIVWNHAAAAARLGVTRRTLHRWLKRYGIDPERPSWARKRRALLRVAHRVYEVEGKISQLGIARYLDVSHFSVQSWLRELRISLERIKTG